MQIEEHGNIFPIKFLLGYRKDPTDLTYTRVEAIGSIIIKGTYQGRISPEPVRNEDQVEIKHHLANALV